MLAENVNFPREVNLMRGEFRERGAFVENGHLPKREAFSERGRHHASRDPVLG